MVGAAAPLIADVIAEAMVLADPPQFVAHHVVGSIPAAMNTRSETSRPDSIWCSSMLSKGVTPTPPAIRTNSFSGCLTVKSPVVG